MTAGIEATKEVQKTKFNPRVLVAFTPECDGDSLVNAAKLLSHSEQVLYVGLVPVPDGENLTEHASKAGDLRKFMQKNSDRVRIRPKARVRVTYTPREELEAVIHKHKIHLLVLDWQTHNVNSVAAEFLDNLPCDVAFVHGPIPSKPENVMVALRGGPHAECAMSVGLKLSKLPESKITTLHLKPTKFAAEESGQFEGLSKIIPEFRDVTHKTIESDDFLGSLLEESRFSDILIMGTASDRTQKTYGKITTAVFENAKGGVIAVKTRRGSREHPKNEQKGSHAISVLVDQWFAENTFHAGEFQNLEKLVQLKKERGNTISIALPTLNEEETIGNILDIIQEEMMQKHKLVDELIVIDSRSTDKTQEIVESRGVPLYVHQDILPQYGARPGKGEALWKSLYLTHGDIVLWLDTDVSNFRSHFVYGLLGPLLYRPEIQLVKGFYRRPLKSGTGLKKGRGGRVTELAARPLLNLFYPELSGIVQPLSGEYGGRRELLEKLTFTSGYGVETCILVETLEQIGLASIGQVDIFERIHNNQPLHSLSKMSFAIIQTVVARLEKRYGKQMLEDINRTMKMIRHDDAGNYHLELQEVAELERPAMNTLPEYRQLWSNNQKKVIN